MINIRVELPQGAAKGYDIFIKHDLLSEIGSKIRPIFTNTNTIALITDDNVGKLYGDCAVKSLHDAGFNVISYSISPGEKSKNIESYYAILCWLADHQVTRADAIVALGGGVVGDLSGFTASTYLRGIPFIQVPTTLLAMVDSSVGGKTGIDIPAGKNLVGAFHRPSSVLCDPSVLNTLTPQVFNDGCAEVVKHGMIRSKTLLEMLLANSINDEIAKIIECNIIIKRDIVQIDEFDTNQRQLLNFGHTIAHAIEKLSNFEISHGCAVAIGMSIITRAAVKKGFCPPKCQEVLEKLLSIYNLPIKTTYPSNAIYEAALTDKKRTGDTITEVVPYDLGECKLHKIPVVQLLEWIEMGIDL